MAAQYKAARTLVTLRPLPPDILAELADKGWTVLDMSKPLQWPQQFEQHAEVFR